MNATVASPSEPAATVTVASLDELREVAEHDPRASEEDGGLRVAVTGVPVSQAEELHALVRDHVEAKLWSVVGEVDAMAALRSAADGAARLVELSRALDAVVRDTEDGVPVPATGPRIDHAADGAGPRRVHPTAAAVPPAQVRRCCRRGGGHREAGGGAELLSVLRRQMDVAGVAGVLDGLLPADGGEDEGTDRCPVGDDYPVRGSSHCYPHPRVLKLGSQILLQFIVT